MLALLAALMLQAEPAAAPPARAEPPRPPADISQAVDAQGVPAWAKRKRKLPVQNCQTRPGIGIDTWRERYEPGPVFDRKRLRPPQAVCR
jgi:hypothetical protein